MAALLSKACSSIFRLLWPDTSVVLLHRTASHPACAVNAFSSWPHATLRFRNAPGSARMAWHRSRQWAGTDAALPSCAAPPTATVVAAHCVCIRWRARMRISSTTTAEAPCIIATKEAQPAACLSFVLAGREGDPRRQSKPFVCQGGPRSSRAAAGHTSPPRFLVAAACAATAVVELLSPFHAQTSPTPPFVYDERWAGDAHINAGSRFLFLSLLGLFSPSPGKP